VRAGVGRESVFKYGSSRKWGAKGFGGGRSRRGTTFRLLNSGGGWKEGSGTVSRGGAIPEVDGCNQTKALKGKNRKNPRKAHIFPQLWLISGGRRGFPGRKGLRVDFLYSTTEKLSLSLRGSHLPGEGFPFRGGCLYTEREGGEVNLRHKGRTELKMRG